MDFAALAAEVDRVAPREANPKGGRPPYPTETMVRIHPGNTSRDVYADRAYPSKEHDEWLRKNGFRHQIQRKGTAQKPLSECQKRRNRRIAKTRARVEHVFASLEQMGGKLIRTVGLARATFAMTMMAACYNARRLVSLHKSGIAPF